MYASRKIATEVQINKKDIQNGKSFLVIHENNSYFHHCKKSSDCYFPNLIRMQGINS